MHKAVVASGYIKQTRMILTWWILDLEFTRAYEKGGRKLSVLFIGSIVLFVST